MASQMRKGDLYRRKIQEFLDEYKKPATQALYGESVKLASEVCETLLHKQLKIKGIVSGRTKKYDSLEKKLKDMSAAYATPDKLDEAASPRQPGDPEEVDKVSARSDVNDVDGAVASSDTGDSDETDEEAASSGANEVESLQKWISKNKSIWEHPEMCDLAGIRIGLYFPEDVEKVDAMLRQHFDLKHVFGTVTGRRNAIIDRNIDPKSHILGQWYSTDRNGNRDHWEHYGYKSWQMVVEWNRALPAALKTRRLEIQVGTIVSQAWAEVQHDIIYKQPAYTLTTPTMKRMIDAINGLAITTDIVLRELGRSLDEAEKENERIFKDGRELLDWFESTHAHEMKKDTPSARKRLLSNKHSCSRADFMIRLSSIIVHGNPWDLTELLSNPFPKASPNGLGKFFAEHGLLHRSLESEPKDSDILTRIVAFCFEGEERSLIWRLIKDSRKMGAVLPLPDQDIMWLWEGGSTLSFRGPNLVEEYIKARKTGCFDPDPTF